MAVLRIVANLGAGNPTQSAAFYRDLFDLEIMMDHGWIVTLGSAASQTSQLSFASQGGGGTPVPHLSIEVDDLDVTLERARAASVPIEYGPIKEQWGVTRFFIRDPEGRLLNILSHD